MKDSCRKFHPSSIEGRFWSYGPKRDRQVLPAVFPHMCSDGFWSGCDSCDMSQCDPSHRHTLTDSSPLFSFVVFRGTMEGTRTSLWLFLLLSQLPSCPADAYENPSAMPFNDTDGHDNSSTPSVKLWDTDNNDTHGNCLMDTEMGLIAIGSAGGMIVCLLVATVVLACQICKLQRRVCAPRTSRSNMDLVSGADHWGVDQSQVGGLVGPCDASVMLEEVKADSKMEENSEAEIPEAKEEAGTGLEEGATAVDFDPEEKVCHMLSSSSRDSCLEIPQDLENMPLVV